MTKTFPEVISGIRTAKKGVEVREDIAQMGEYVEQFAATATQKAEEAAASEKKASDAVANIDQQKADSVAAVQQAQTTATTAITQTKDAALTDIGNAKTGALQEVANSTATAETAASAAAGSASDANASKEAAATSAAAAADSASAASTSETNSSASASAAATSEANAKKYSEEAGAKANTDKTLSIENAPADAKATGDVLAGKLGLSGGTMTGPLILPGGLTALGYANNAGNRNAMPPRDRSLGTPTTEHFEMIASDKYNELFLGDYWTVEGVDWVIGDFKLWYNTGDTACTKPHVVAFPRNNLYSYKFNPTSTTEGGYVGSDLYKNGLTQAKQMVDAAFGSDHILSHREILVNAVANGKPTGTDWYYSTVELMNENMVYGGRQFSPMPDGIDSGSACQNYTIDKSQLSLFRYEPWLACNRNWYWLRDIVSATTFASAHNYCFASCANSSTNGGVRPVVGIC